MPIPYPSFQPSVQLPQGGVTGQEGDTTLSEPAKPSKEDKPFDFNQAMTMMMMNMMNQGGQGVAGGQGIAPAVAAPALNPNLGALLQHFGSGATRRTMGGQVEGTPAPDPFTNLNAMRDSQQAHDLSRMNHSIQMQKLQQQGGFLPQASFTPNADQVRADLNARQGLGQAPAPKVEQFGPYESAPQGPDWTSVNPSAAWMQTNHPGAYPAPETTETPMLLPTSALSTQKQSPMHWSQFIGQ